MGGIMLKRIINTLKTFRAWNSNYSTRKFCNQLSFLSTLKAIKLLKIMISSFTRCPGNNFVSQILERRSIIKSVYFSDFVGMEIDRCMERSFPASKEKNQARLGWFFFQGETIWKVFLCWHGTLYMTSLKNAELAGPIEGKWWKIFNLIYKQRFFPGWTTIFLGFFTQPFFSNKFLIGSAYSNKYQIILKGRVITRQPKNISIKLLITAQPFVRQVMPDFTNLIIVSLEMKT